jgi:hypothetical protein
MPGKSSPFFTSVSRDAAQMVISGYVAAYHSTSKDVRKWLSMQAVTIITINESATDIKYIQMQPKQRGI